LSEATPAVPAAKSGFFERLVGLYSGPTEAFRGIVPRPTVLVPFLILVVLAVGFTALWVSKVDAPAYIREQIDQTPRGAEMPAEQKARIIEMQAKFFKFTPAFVAVGVPLFYLFVAGLYLVVFRFLYGAELTYKQSLSITLWSFLAVALVSTPLLIAVFALKGDWNLDPGKALQANLSLLVPSTAPKWLNTLASSLDLFSFWNMALLAAGYGVASRRKLSGALAGVMGPWVLFVVLKVGWAALRG
jgi:Yip1 domain